MTTYLVAVHLLVEAGPEPRAAIDAALHDILSDAMRQNAGGQSPLVDWAVAGEDLASLDRPGRTTRLLCTGHHPVSGMAGGMFAAPRPGEFVMTPLGGPVPAARIRAACSEARSNLARIERQIEHRAERRIITAKAKARSSRRHRAGWTPADERLFRELVDHLTFERRGDIEALS